jgi:thiamine biosynthesis protein ThiS
MNLVINGEEKSFSDSLTIADLIANLSLKPDRIAVELNREIVSRQNWPATRLKNGDRLEIVHFVGGGASAFS